MKNKFCVLFLIFMGWCNVYTDQYNVPFLKYEPLIDGAPDRNILNLPIKNFNYIETSAEGVQTPEISYCLAYGMSFFYILISVQNDAIIYRDRAYQNGDGFIITITKPKQGNEPADEFYVLGFSPGDVSLNIQERKFIWYRNIDLSFQKLNDTKLSVSVIDGKAYYEALIYWKEIYPFHPCLSESIGFNICFVKASGQNDKSYHYAVYDEYLQSEQHERKYDVLKFGRPAELNIPQLYCILSKNNLTKKDEMSLTAYCIGKPGSIVNLRTNIKEDGGCYSQKNEYSLYNSKGCTQIQIDIPLGELGNKNYTLDWNAGAYSSGTIHFSILPLLSGERALGEIETMKEKISDGSYQTLRFMLDDIKLRQENLKIYESCPELLKEMNSFVKYVEAGKNNTDTLMSLNGIFRRGFLSELDATYRPYTIRIPAKFDRNKKYALVVYLHGSGDDDRVAFNMKPLADSNFIELYPNARGTSHAYSTPESHTDIIEAITDVKKNYPIDTAKIILSGFSMGGYGVYRTFYESPWLFKALAVFSGHPDLANKWIGGRNLNFLDENNLGSFENTKIFIFHGTEDRNCPYELTEELVEKLRQKGAEVEFVTENTGHSSPSEETMEIFHQWLKMNIKN